MLISKFSFFRLNIFCISSIYMEIYNINQVSGFHKTQLSKGSELLLVSYPSNFLSKLRNLFVLREQFQ